MGIWDKLDELTWPEPPELEKLAYENLANGNFEKAQRQADALSKKGPRWQFGGLCISARLAFARGNGNKGEQLYAEAGKLVPSSVPDYLLDDLRSVLVWTEDNRIPVLRTLLTAEPDDTEVLADLGEALYHEEEYAEAIEVLQRARDQDPLDARKMHCLAHALTVEENAEEAFDVCIELLEQASQPYDELEAIASIATACCVDEDDYERLHDAWETYHEEAEKNETTYKNRVQCSWRSGNKKRAYHELAQAMKQGHLSTADLELLVEAKYHLEIQTNIDLLLDRATTLVDEWLEEEQVDEKLTIELSVLKARMLVANGRHEVGCRSFRTLAQRFPNSPAAQKELVQHLFVCPTTEPEAALAPFENVRKNFPPLEASLLQWASELYDKVGRIDKVAELLEEAWKRSPTSFPVLCNLLEAYLERGESEKGVEVGRAALDLKAPSPRWRGRLVLNMGKCELASGQAERGAEHLQEAVSIFGKIEDAAHEADALMALARCQLRLKQSEIAEKTLERAIALRGQDAEPHLHLARLYAETNRRPAAVAELRILLTDHPKYADAYHFFADLLLEEGRRDEAVELLQRSTEYSPADALAWYRLGALVFEKDKQTAIACHKRLVDLNKELAGKLFAILYQ